MRSAIFREIAICGDVRVQGFQVSYHALVGPAFVDRLPAPIGDEIVLALLLIVSRSPPRRKPTLATIVDPDRARTMFYLRDGKFSTGEQLFVVDLSGFVLRRWGRYVIELECDGYEVACCTFEIARSRSRKNIAEFPTGRPSTG
jgi:hypothetical protein